MIETLRQRLLPFANRIPFEYWPTLVIFSGIATFNREFVHIGFRRFYVTEVLLLGTLLVALSSALFSAQHRAVLRGFCGRRFLLLHLLCLYAAVRLLAQHDEGLLAVRHSMMVFSAAFVVLFAFAFTTHGLLVRTLRYLFVLTSVFNAAKIVRNWVTGARFEAEPLRVAHNEVDVICASLSLIGLIVLTQKDDRRQWLWLAPLAAANLFILVLTVKRTAVLGLLLVLVIAVAFRGRRLGARLILRVAAIALALAILSYGMLAWLHPQSIAPLASFLAEKVQFSTEANATWRVAAWRLAWQRFVASPLLGIGYGLPILQSALRDTRTEDPHNSFLAFVVRHGVVGGLLLLALLIQACVRYVRQIRSSQSAEARSLALFFFMSFVYMVNFALFNVVLENQYEGIFFWFALSGTFILAGAKDPAAVAVGREAEPQDRVRLSALLEIGKRSWRPELAVASPLTWIRGATLAGAAVYAFLIVSPWNHLPRIDIYAAGRQAQVPAPDAGHGATVQVTNGLDGVHVAVDPHWPQPSAIEWTLPETLTDDFRLQRPPREWWDRALGVKWMLPEDFARTTRRGTDYAIVLELGSPEQAHRPYAFILEDYWGNSHRAIGQAVGSARLVPLREFESGGAVRWKDTRHLRLQLPPLPRPLSLQVKSLYVAREADVLRAYGTAGDAPVRACTVKNLVAGRLILDAETLEREEGENRFAFGAPGNGSVRGVLWAHGDGTGPAVLQTVAGVAGKKSAVRASSPRLSGWGIALGVWCLCLDATGYGGVEFWVRGSAPTGLASLECGTRETSSPETGYPEKGTCVGADPAADCYPAVASFPVTDRWTRVRLAWSDFRPGFNGSGLVGPNGDNITGFSFVVPLKHSPETAQVESSAVELAFDGLSFF